MCKRGLRSVSEVSCFCDLEFVRMCVSLYVGVFACAGVVDIRPVVFIVVVVFVKTDEFRRVSSNG